MNNNYVESDSLVSDSSYSEKVDCKVSHWKQEPCSAIDCGGIGYKWKFRTIIVSFYEADIIKFD